jgi:hypothetical protein
MNADVIQVAKLRVSRTRTHTFVMALFIKLQTPDLLFEYVLPLTIYPV